MTTGGSSSLDLWVDKDAWSGEIVIDTSEINARVDLATLPDDGEIFPCGGMDIRLVVTPLPADLSETQYFNTHRVPLNPNREARLFVRVTQEDGHQAWSSPIYIHRI